MTDYSTINPCLVHCGVDWITLTALDQDKGEFLLRAATWLSSQAVLNGNDKKPWSMSGFRGWTTKGVQYGTRDAEVIVRLSGDTAHDNWKEVYDDANNCTRIDVQATFKLNCEVTPVINRHFDQAKRFSKDRKRAPTLSMLSTNNGPSTLYFNRRVSETFGRIYDKGAESKLDHLRNCIRYEVELKGNAAQRMSAYLRSREDSDMAAGLYAVDFFERRSCRLGK